MDKAAVKILINAFACFFGNGENRVGIRADEHEAGLSERKQSCKAVKQIHGHGDKRIDRAFFDDGKDDVSLPEASAPKPP